MSDGNLPVPPATILCVDDEANILAALRRLFRPAGYKVLLGNSGAEGLQLLEAENGEVDVVISDMRMPEMDGARFLAQVRARWPKAARILLTGYADIESTVAAINQGEIYRYIAKPWNDSEVMLTVKDVLERKALEREKARLEELTRRQNEELKSLNASLEEKVQARTQELALANEKLKTSFMTSIRVFANLIELREGRMAGHSRRVADLSRKTAKQMNLSPRDSQDVFLAGLLHDIGKLAAVSAFELAIERIGSPVLDMETWWSVIERHHVEMGVALAGHWHLPKSLMSVIANHHTRSNEGAQSSVMGLIQAVDMVVELAEYHPSLSLDLLLDTPLTAPERLAVMDLLPGLASQVAALENPGGNVKPSLVSVPDVAISAPFRRVNVEAKVVSPKVDPLTFTHIGPLGIIAVAPQPLVAGQLHLLHIQPAEGEPLDLWATPYAITDAAVPNVHLLKPFVVDGATHARYLTWVKHGP